MQLPTLSYSQETRQSEPEQCHISQYRRRVASDDSVIPTTASDFQTRVGVGKYKSTPEAAKLNFQAIKAKAKASLTVLKGYTAAAGNTDEKSLGNNCIPAGVLF